LRPSAFDPERGDQHQIAANVQAVDLKHQQVRSGQARCPSGDRLRGAASERRQTLGNYDGPRALPTWTAAQAEDWDESKPLIQI
jgi:hypothetical protein